LAKYKEEYIELTEDLEEAKERNDLGRISSLQKKLDFFATEIAKATGFGGRKREKSDVERVRKNVSMAVTRAIDGIHADHERLGNHLRKSVTSGLFFCYDPEHDPRRII